MSVDGPRLATRRGLIFRLQSLGFAPGLSGSKKTYSRGRAAHQCNEVGRARLPARSSTRVLREGGSATPCRPAMGAVWTWRVRASTTSMVSRASAVGCHPLREVPSLRRRGSTLTWLVSARLFLRAIRARALVAAAAGACLADHGEMILTDSSPGPSAAVLEARLRRSRRGGDGVPDAHVRRRFVEVEIAAAPGPTPQAKEVERADEPRNAITPAGTRGPQPHCAAASASASVR